jgi:hypothetical protein
MKMRASHIKSPGRREEPPSSFDGRPMTALRADATPRQAKFGFSFSAMVAKQVAQRQTEPAQPETEEASPQKAIQHQEASIRVPKPTPARLNYSFLSAVPMVQREGENEHQTAHTAGDGTPVQLLMSAGTAPMQRQQWKYEVKKRVGARFVPYMLWHSATIDRPKWVTVETDGGPQKKYREGDQSPASALNDGDIFDDVSGDITTAEKKKAEQKEQKKKTAAKKTNERKRQHELETGKGLKSKRLRGQAEVAYTKKKASVTPDEDTGVYHFGGDSPGHGYDFEEEGLHSGIKRRVGLMAEEQTNIIESGDLATLPWNELKPGLRSEIETRAQTARDNPDIIHHSEGDRPKYTSARLGQGNAKRPKLSDEKAHVGIGSNLTDLSHSIPHHQVSDDLRTTEEGGVNHPKNTPHENFVTNQVVNVAIEDIADEYLAQEKEVVKVVYRIWDVDRVAKSLHVYFVAGVEKPLVFGTRDLQEKKPARFEHRGEGDEEG